MATNPSLTRDDLPPLRRDHEHDDPVVGRLREEPDRPVAQDEVAAAGVEAVHAPALEVTAVDEARPDGDIPVDWVAVGAGAIGPVLAVERVAPARPRVDALGDHLAARVIDVRPAA